jgi:regulator of sirC expression with transglutaminase-like and TPR domain
MANADGYPDGMEATEAFAALLLRPPEAIPLDEVALLIAAHAYPDLDIPAELARLDRMAAHCPAPALDELVTYLFSDLGFVGNTRDYFDPRNSFLNEVLNRRTGIPISLAVLTMAIGDRIGLPVLGVRMPGHFLLRDRDDPNLFVDPFGGGALLDPSGCERAFRAVHGDDATFDVSFLEPVDVPAIVARMLANLRATFASRGNRASLAWVLRLRTLVPGTAPEDRAELASVLAADGQFVAASLEFEVLADQLGGALGAEYHRSAEQLRARLN